MKITGFNERLALFRRFVERAEELAAPAAESSTAKRFLKFIEAARPLSINLDRPSPVIGFRKFVETGRPMVVARVKGLLPQIREQFALGARWVVQDDLLAIAGFSFVENSYTALMAWALRPIRHRLGHASGDG